MAPFWCSCCGSLFLFFWFLLCLIFLWSSIYQFKNICPRTFSSVTWTWFALFNFNYSSVWLAGRDSLAPKSTLGYTFLLLNACWNTSQNPKRGVSKIKLSSSTNFFFSPPIFPTSVNGCQLSGLLNNYLIPFWNIFLTFSSHFSSSSVDFSSL